MGGKKVLGDFITMLNRNLFHCEKTRCGVWYGMDCNLFLVAVYYVDIFV